MSQGSIGKLKAFAEANEISWVHFEKEQRQGDVAAWYRRRFQADEGVVFIGVAQERAYAFKGRKEQQRKRIRIPPSQT